MNASNAGFFGNNASTGVAGLSMANRIDDPFRFALWIGNSAAFVLLHGSLLHFVFPAGLQVTTLIKRCQPPIGLFLFFFCVPKKQAPAG